MFHGESKVFSEGAEERKVGFCVVFVSVGSTSIIDEVGGGRKIKSRFRPLLLSNLCGFDYERTVHGSTLVFEVEEAVEFQAGVELSIQKVILGFRLQWCEAWLEVRVLLEGSGGNKEYVEEGVVGEGGVKSSRSLNSNPLRVEAERVLSQRF